MRTSSAILTVLLLTLSVGARAELEGYEAALDGDAAVAVAGPSCHVPTVRRCCAEAGAQLSINCEMQGVRWPCHAAPSANPLIRTTKAANTGWLYSYESGNTAQCKFKAMTCGPGVGECTAALVETVLNCKERLVAEPLCETPLTADPY